MEKENLVSIEERIPKLKQARKKKANRRLLFYLSIFFVLISIIIYLQSPLSDIKQIEITGNHVLSDKEIIQESGLSTNTNIWIIQKGNIAEKLEKHPVVKNVEVHRKLPQTVQMDVGEHNIVGYLKNDAAYHPILENGRIITKESITNRGNGPLLNNFTEESYLQRMATELNKLPDDIFNLISEISWEPTEKNKYKIVMYMNDGFIVQATIRNFATKMETYPSIISQLDKGDKGIIHMGVGTYFESFEK